jgi:hypothetical protein
MKIQLLKQLSSVRCFPSFFSLERLFLSPTRGAIAQAESIVVANTSFKDKTSETALTDRMYRETEARWYVVWLVAVSASGVIGVFYWRLA